MYTIVFDVLSFSIFNGVLLIFGLAPTVALASIGLTVMISAKVKGFREAQISAILLIPVLALVFGQVTGAIIFGLIMISALIGLFAVIDFCHIQNRRETVQKRRNPFKISQVQACRTKLLMT
jgi:ABC-2 type transport system permease protein